jgi:MtN3 and saliva related transmembrane protein
MTQIDQILGWVATFLFSIMVLPQIIKTIRSKDTTGVSLGLFVLYLNANIIALIYAFMIDQSPLIIIYIAIFLMYNKIHYRSS